MFWWSRVGKLLCAPPPPPPVFRACYGPVSITPWGTFSVHVHAANSPDVVDVMASERYQRRDDAQRDWPLSAVTSLSRFLTVSGWMGRLWAPMVMRAVSVAERWRSRKCACLIVQSSQRDVARGCPDRGRPVTLPVTRKCIYIACE